MSTTFQILTRSRIKVIIIALFSIACVVCVLHFAFLSNDSHGIPDIYDIGGKWVSDEGSTIFTSYAKMLVLTSSAGKSDVCEIEYFGLGCLSNSDNKSWIICDYFRDKNGTYYIQFYESEHTLDLAKEEVTVSYTGQILAELKLTSYDKNNFSAIVTYASPDQDNFILNKTICFTQVNDFSKIDLDEYRLYFNGNTLIETNINYADTSSIHSIDITLYTKAAFYCTYGLDEKN